MDVKYIPSDWKKMKSGVGDLIGLGRWGKGMIDDLKDITGNLEDAESDIARYDSDGVISFQHIDRDGKYQSLFEDFKVLHNFTGKVGDIVDRTIDHPFYEDIDGFVAAIRDASISNYTTENRIGATEIQVIHYGHGIHETQEIDKTEVNLDDLLSGGNFYSDQMKLEYEAWKEVNPDQEFSQEDYQLAAVNMRAFGYESIKDQQLNKEFWVNVAALVVIVGVSLVCPPAGLSLGIAYGTFELSSAVSGKDWISGRELGTAERWTRGLLAPLDIVPGVAGIKKFSGAVRSANYLVDMGQFGAKTGLKSAIQHEMNHVGNMVITAGKQSSTRLKSAGKAIKDGARVAKNKAIDQTINVAKVTDNVVTSAKNINPTRKVVALGQGMDVKIPAENTHYFANKTREILGKADGVNVGAPGSIVSNGEKLANYVNLMGPEDAKRYSQYWDKLEIGMNSEARVATGKMSSDSFVNTILPGKLKEHQISFDDFNRLKQTPDYQLLDTERIIMKDIRDSVPWPDQNSLLVKNIGLADIEKYISGQYDSIRGFIAKTEDAAHIQGYSHVRESMRLDYSYYDEYADTIVRPYPENGNSYGYIRFNTNTPDVINSQFVDIPYGHTIDPPYNGWQNNEWPWTGNGFTSSRNHEVIPEWTLTRPVEFSQGSEIYQVIDGKETLVAVFENQNFYVVAKY